MRRYDVSAQEAIAAAMEDAIPQFDLTGRVRRRAGDVPREAGTGIYACADGYVSMVAGRLGTARAWKALTAWLVRSPASRAPASCCEERWQSFPYRQRPESIERFREIFEWFTRPRAKDALYLEAQRRSIALAPVNEVADVVADPQLEARRFFRTVVAAGARPARPRPGSARTAWAATPTSPSSLPDRRRGRAAAVQPADPVAREAARVPAHGTSPPRAGPADR